MANDDLGLSTCQRVLSRFVRWLKNIKVRTWTSCRRCCKLEEDICFLWFSLSLVSVLSLFLYNPLSCTVLNNINFLFVIQFKRVFPFVQDNNLFDLSLSFPCQKNHLQKPITIYYYFFGSALYPVIWSRCFLERQTVLLFVWFFSLVYQTEGRSPFSGFRLSRLVSFTALDAWKQWQLHSGL